MGDNTIIEWADATWSPLRARVKDDAKQIAERLGYGDMLSIIRPGKVGHHCEHASKGCLNCYSETNNERSLPANGTGLPFTRRSRDLVDMFIDEDMLRKPLHWKRPRRIFVESQSDLFGEFVTDDMIDEVFAVMALASWHTFLVLTKRAERMKMYFGPSKELRGMTRDCLVEGLAQKMHHETTGEDPSLWLAVHWPLSNVHLGVSVEDQKSADKRIHHLLLTPASKRWVSYEPALSAVDFTSVKCVGVGFINALTGMYDDGDLAVDGLDWVVVGGESGPGSRPFDVMDAQRTIDQCKTAKVSCFVKQLGAKPRYHTCRNPSCTHQDCGWVDLKLKHRKGGDVGEWPRSLSVREFPR